jgi:hypothetical protein
MQYTLNSTSSRQLLPFDLLATSYMPSDKKKSHFPISTQAQHLPDSSIEALGFALSIVLHIAHLQCPKFNQKKLTLV